ncbi:MAG: protein kinase [Acidobacteriota bacterium]
MTTTSPGGNSTPRTPGPGASTSSGLPRQIGAYQVEEEIGRGSSGVVLRAIDTRLDRTVALKAVSLELAEDAQQLERFEREAKVLAALHHPNVAMIHALERVEGRPVLVLEHVGGDTLYRVLLNGRMEPDAACRVGAQVAAALEAAHALGIIHRDLKPANVKFSTRGVAKVLDFGLARHLQPTGAGDGPGTLGRAMVGTPGYMSPEQVHGGKVDQRTDIWALGSVLFECVTGRPAFDGSTWADRIAAILHVDPDWSLLPDGTPPRLRSLLESCLHRDPAQRPREVAEVRGVLEELLKERPWGETGELILPREPAVKAVLVTDCVRLLQADELDAGQRVGLHDWMAAMRQRHSGREIAEGWVFLFEEPLAAVEAALELHAGLSEIGEALGRPMAARVGIHLGEVLLRTSASPDGASIVLEGRAMPLARSLMGLALPGQSLLSRGAADPARRAESASVGGLRWVRHGSYRLPMGDVVDVVEVGRPGRSLIGPPADSERGRRERPGRLPEQVTSFVGRTRELEVLEQNLRQHRLVTVFGTGGCGKTRLSLVLAERWRDLLTGGSWFVDLSDCVSREELARRVAQALGLREGPGQEMEPLLRDHLSSRELLLVLDGCEGLTGLVGRFVESLLRACPRLRILATSREALGISEEVVFSLQPFPVAELDRLDLAQLAQVDACRLFVERARQAQPEFRLEAGNAGSIQIACQCLGGLPLAIELAAARVKEEGVDEIARRLEQSLSLEDGDGSREALSAALAWSHRQLGPAEQLLFRRLAIFAGAWSLEAAEEVCGSPEMPLAQMLCQLIDRSLVQVSRTVEGRRHRLLEPVKIFAREQLERSGEMAVLRERHRHRVLRLVESAVVRLRGPQQASWLARLESEHEEIRTALARCGDDEGKEVEELRIAAAAWSFWHLRGHWALGREALTRALDRARRAPAPMRCLALEGAGVLAGCQGDLHAARALHEECLALRRAEEDWVGVSSSLDHLGELAMAAGELTTARALFEESLARRQAVDDEHGVADSQHHLGRVALARGDLASAGQLLDDSHERRRRLGDSAGIAACLTDLGALSCARGDLQAAQAALEESLAIRRELGDGRGIADNLARLSELATIACNLSSARSLSEEALALRRELGDKRGVADSLTQLGQVVLEQGEPAEARSLHEEALDLKRELGGRATIASSLLALGRVAEAEGELESAWQLGVEALRLHRGSSDSEQAGLAETLECLGQVAAGRQRAALAVQLLGAAEALRERLGSPPPRDHGTGLAAALASARQALGTEAFDATWQQGRALRLEQAVLRAMSAWEFPAA